MSKVKQKVLSIVQLARPDWIWTFHPCVYRAASRPSKGHGKEKNMVALKIMPRYAWEPKLVFFLILLGFFKDFSESFDPYIYANNKNAWRQNYMVIMAWSRPHLHHNNILSNLIRAYFEVKWYSCIVLTPWSNLPPRRKRRGSQRVRFYWIEKRLTIGNI